MSTSVQPPGTSRTFKLGQMDVEIHRDNESMGRAAAAEVVSAIRRLAGAKDTIRIILGSANSQLTFIDALAREPGVPWNRVVGFHMDEYIGIDANHPASFRRWMRERFADRLRPHEFHYIAGEAADPAAEIERYAGLLRAKPIDITCLGFGENGHLAFNDPPFADFADPKVVKIVQLDERSRTQQVGEGHFPNIDSVPTHALTVTIPTLLSATHIIGIVPERRKAEAVRAALEGPVSENCPASILRLQPQARLFLDTDSAALLSNNKT